MKIWECRKYREYLMSVIGPEGSRSGMRKKLAEGIGVHTTFVSQVLKGMSDFSPEQADAISGFFNHTEDEAEYFLLLVLKERAGTHSLKQKLERKLKGMRDQRLNIGKRIDAENEISAEDKERFYSSALYGAVHVLSSLPDCESSEEMAMLLNQPIKRVAEIVEFLLKIGLLKTNKNRLVPGPNHIHLSNETEMVLKHHINWRMHSISNLQFLNREDLHYSSCISISKDDAFRVKEMILETLKKTVDTVKKTKVETAYVLTFDFYEISENT